MEQSHRVIQAYRKLKIIELFINQSNQKRIFPSVFIGFPSLQFFTSYVCIRLHDIVEWPAFAMFPLVYVDAFILAVVIFTAAAKVYNNSGELLQNLKASPDFGRKSVLRRNIRAVTSIKIKFGVNFVDSETPLVIQDFCTRTTATFLLISQG